MALSPKIKLVLLAVLLPLGIWVSVYVLSAIFLGDVIVRETIGAHGSLFFLLLFSISLPLMISAFLPYKWASVIRNISYLSLFVGIMLILVGIIRTVVKSSGVDIPLEDCKMVFLPETTEGGKPVIDALKYISCVLSGKYPGAVGDAGWAAFYLFYLILPAAFIFTFIYGTMKSIDMSYLFGNDQRVPRILSFIIALYAVRTMIGGFLLQFAGYGAWGLAAMFIAILFTSIFKNMIEKWFFAEKFSREYTERLSESKRWIISFADFAIQQLETLNDKDLFQYAPKVVDEIRKSNLYARLPSHIMDIVDDHMNGIKTAPEPNIMKERIQDFYEYLKNLKKTLK